MIARKHFLVAVCATLGLAAGSSFAQDSKNPLMPPKSTTAAKPAEIASPAGAPSMDTRLPPPGNAAGAAAPMVAAPNVGSHLAGMNVVAIVGDKAILRGLIGKGSSFALVAASDVDGGKGPGVLAAQQQGGGDDASRAPSVTIVVTHGQPLQLSEGVWIRPDVSGLTVRLFQQPSKGKVPGSSADVLVYAASLETLSPTAPLAADKGEDKKQEK